MTTLGTLDVKITGDASRFNAAVRQANAGAASMGKGFTNAGKNYEAFNRKLSTGAQVASRAGSALTRGVTLPVLGLAAAAIKTSMDVETSFASVKKTVDATPAGFRKLETELRGMAKELIIPLKTLNEIAAQAGALGVKSADIGQFTKAVAQLSVAADDVTFDQAATTLGKLKNVLNLSVKDVSRFTDAIVQLGNNGASTEGEILAMANRMGGAGRVIGLTADQIAGFAAAFADAGIEAEAGGTAFTKTIEEMATAVRNGTPELKGFAKIASKAGVDFVKTWKKSPAQAIAGFIEGLRKVHKEGGSVGQVLDDLGITEIRQRLALEKLAVAQNSVSDSLRIAHGAYVKGGAAAEEMRKKNETSAKKLEAVKIALQDIAVDVGPPLVSALQTVAAVVKSVAEAFARLPKGTQEFIVKALLLAATLGPVIKLLGGFLNAWKLLREFKMAMGLGKAAADIAGIGSAASGARGPVGKLLGSLLSMKGLGTIAIVIVASVVAKKLVEKGAKGLARGMARAAGGLPAGEAFAGPGKDAIRQLREQVALLNTSRTITDGMAMSILKVTDHLKLSATEAGRVKKGLSDVLLAARSGADIGKVMKALADGESIAAVKADILAGKFNVVKASAAATKEQLVGMWNQLATTGEKVKALNEVWAVLGQKLTVIPKMDTSQLDPTVAAAAEKLNKFGALKPVAQLMANNSPLLGKVGQALQKLGIVTKSEWEALIQANNGPALSKIAGVHSKLNGVGARVARPTISAQDHATGIIGRIIGMLGRIPRNVITTIKTVYHKIFGHEGGTVHPEGIYHGGGRVRRLHGGGRMSAGEVDARLLTGEGVINRRGMASLGMAGLNFLNRGGLRGRSHPGNMRPSATRPLPGRGGSGPTVHVAVHGSVITERELRDFIQEQLLRLGIRNSTTGIR